MEDRQLARCYRLSKIGAKLPLRHNYAQSVAGEGADGFEVFKGPIYSLANSIGPAVGSPGEGDFTPAAGYDLLLLIDAELSKWRAHSWNQGPWVVISPSDVQAVRSLEVAVVHSWLREHPACVGPDGQLSRDAVVSWVRANQELVERWLEEQSAPCPIDFVETLGDSRGGP
jgi:hypothetical protein